MKRSWDLTKTCLKAEHMVAPHVQRHCDLPLTLGQELKSCLVLSCSFDLAVCLHISPTVPGTSPSGLNLNMKFLLDLSLSGGTLLNWLLCAVWALCLHVLDSTLWLQWAEYLVLTAAPILAPLDRMAGIHGCDSHLAPAYIGCIINELKEWKEVCPETVQGMWSEWPACPHLTVATINDLMGTSPSQCSVVGDSLPFLLLRMWVGLGYGAAKHPLGVG